MSVGLVARCRRGGALTLVSGATIALTACASASTVDTEAMTASIVVVAGDMDSQVSVVLSAGDRTSFELPSGDRVDASAETDDGTASATLEDTTYLGSHSYAGGLAAVTTPSTEVSVTLRRGDDSTAVSTVALPGPIFLVQPTAGQEVSRDRDLVMGVNAGAGSNRVEWSGACVTEGSVDVAQGRPVVVPAGSVEPALDADPSASCAVTFVVSRIFDGELDPAFAGGSITAQRSVAVSVTSLA